MSDEWLSIEDLAKASGDEKPKPPPTNKPIEEWATDHLRGRQRRRAMAAIRRRRRRRLKRALRRAERKRAEEEATDA